MKRTLCLGLFTAILAGGTCLAQAGKISLQSLNIGMYNIGTFAYVGGFSSAPNTNKFGGMYNDVEFLSDPVAVQTKLRRLWIACGNKDGLIRVSQEVHNYLKEKGVPHIRHVDSNVHDPTE